MQRTVFFTGIALSTGCCAYLVTRGATGKPILSLLPIPISSPLLPVEAKKQTRKEQTFEAYLDSLENAIIQDSINQANQTTDNHAAQNTLP